MEWMEGWAQGRVTKTHSNQGSKLNKWLQTQPPPGGLHQEACNSATLDMVPADTPSGSQAHPMLCTPHLPALPPMPAPQACSGCECKPLQCLLSTCIQWDWEITCKPEHFRRLPQEKKQGLSAPRLAFRDPEKVCSLKNSPKKEPRGVKRAHS